MSQSKLVILLTILIALLTPIGFAHADGAWINDFNIIEAISGENVTVTITVGYDFTSSVQLNPGIFSFEVDDWIVDTFDTVSGSETKNYTLDFPSPVEDGIYQYQANVWYTIQNKWFFDGAAATYNFTIQIGEEDKTIVEDYLKITSYSAPTSLNVSSSVNMSISLDYKYTNETEISINVRDSSSEILVEEFDSLVGENAKTYNLTFSAPDTNGLYLYTINVEDETRNALLVDKIGLSITTIKPTEKEPDEPVEPDTPPEVTPPTTTDPETPDTPDPVTPPKTGGNTIYYGIAVLAGAVAVYMYWSKKS